ncbi:hypothetical protein KHC28_23725 [Ancylobacter sonchi]|uniref:hypothetical protein n=1 Tax=Ancylobacter sonchi TaxID=1937790 RepID=UPI001BD43262|nr:hypothetical protein [Ancylobacter sonchi]MBS7536672.1 hypothetical protein [Ancylobacter sonchi]
MFRLFLTAFLVVASLNAARAQWIAQSQGGAFDDEPMHVALTLSGRYGLGLRCKGDTTEIVFTTPEKVLDEDTLRGMNVVGPKLRARIDKGEIIELDGTVDAVDDKLLVIADAEIGLFEKIRDARSSVAVVVTLLGKNYHETTFNVRGSKAAIAKIIKGCKLG